MVVFFYVVMPCAHLNYIFIVLRGEFLHSQRTLHTLIQKFGTSFLSVFFFIYFSFLFVVTNTVCIRLMTTSTIIVIFSYQIMSKWKIMASWHTRISNVCHERAQLQNDIVSAQIGAER